MTPLRRFGLYALTAATSAADPEYIGHHPLGVPQCTSMDRTRRWRCSRIPHTQTWHVCWDIAGHTLGTWETT